MISHVAKPRKRGAYVLDVDSVASPVMSEVPCCAVAISYQCHDTVAFEKRK